MLQCPHFQLKNRLPYSTEWEGSEGGQPLLVPNTYKYVVVVVKEFMLARVRAGVFFISRVCATKERVCALTRARLKNAYALARGLRPGALAWALAR